MLFTSFWTYLLSTYIKMNDKINQNWKNKDIYFKRKSKYLLFLIILKILILVILMIAALYLMVIFHNKTQEYDLWIIVIILVYIFIWFIYLNIIFSITNYFYNVMIITHKSIYHFKLWLLMSEYVYIYDLYKIQEVNSNINWFLNVILNIWEVSLIEWNDKENKIHFLDDPQALTHIIRNNQKKFVDKSKNK